MDSERFRKTSVNVQDTSQKHCGFRFDASLAIPTRLSLCSRDDDSEIASRTIYCILRIGPTTRFRSLIPT